MQRKSIWQFLKTALSVSSNMGVRWDAGVRFDEVAMRGKMTFFKVRI